MRFAETAKRGWAAVLRRPPVVTLGLIVCIVVTYARLEVNWRVPMLEFDTWAYSPRGLVQGRYHTLLTSTLLTNYFWMVVSICFSLLVTLGTYEVIAGHVRAAVLAVVASVLGPATVTAALGIFIAFGSNWGEQHLGTLDIGASAIIAMSSGAVAGIVHHKKFTIGLILFLLSGLVIHHKLADWEHLFIFPFGYVAGRLAGRAGQPRRSPTRYVAAALVLTAVAVASSGQVFPAPRVMHDAKGDVLSPARLVSATFASPALGRSPQHVEVFLPPGYDNHPNLRYPVVELLHGDPGSPDDFFSAGNVMQSATEPGVLPFIAVAPTGTGHGSAYSWFADVPGQRMGSSVTQDVRVWVSAHFRTTQSWSYVGISSGAFGAAYAPLVDPYPVHAVCSLTGYFSVSDAIRYGAAHILSKQTPAQQRASSAIDNISREPQVVFLAYGNQDPVATKLTDSFAAALRRGGHHVELKVYPGTHSWAVWRQAFSDCFRAILPSSGPTSNVAETGIPAPPTGGAPRLITSAYTSPALGGRRQGVDVLLPAGYASNPHRRYPVVEFLHGSPGNADGVFAFGYIQQAATLPGVEPFIGVAPEGTGPVHRVSWFANSTGQSVGTSVTRDLHAWVTEHFRTTSSWSFAGLSSGGFAATYLPLVAPFPVHASCALSGYFTATDAAHDGAQPLFGGESPAQLRAASALDNVAHEPHQVFIAYGTEDKLAAQLAGPFAAALRRAHHEVTVKVYPGTHSWLVWRYAFPDCLQLILPRQKV